MEQWKEKVEDLRRNEGSLTISDACFVLRVIQEQTAPLLSLRAPDSRTLQQVHSSVASTVPVGNVSSTNQVRSGSPSTNSSSISKKHPVVRKGLNHKGPFPKGPLLKGEDASRNDGGVNLDLASLDDFPPMSVSVQDKRYQGVKSFLVCLSPLSGDYNLAQPITPFRRPVVVSALYKVS